jgi:hypothetical protein
MPGDLRNTSMESLLRLRVVGRWFQTPGDFELHFTVRLFLNTGWFGLYLVELSRFIPLLVTSKVISNCLPLFMITPG